MEIRERGVVVMCNRKFGFIQPRDIRGVRQDEVFFNRFATRGAILRRNDQVEFILQSEPTPGKPIRKKPVAQQVWLLKKARQPREEITTLHGEFET
jgi:hypothetical protein